MDKGENSRLVESENENLEPQRRGYLRYLMTKRKESWRKVPRWDWRDDGRSEEQKRLRVKSGEEKAVNEIW